MVKVLHIKSNVVTDNKPKLPTKEQIEYGEIAVNYAADHETISLRNSKNEIKTFSSDEYYTKQKLGTAFTDSTVTDVLNNELKTKLNVADFNSYSGSVSNNEQVIAGGISELKNEISGKQDKGNYVLKGESYTKTESDTKYLAKTDYDTDKTTFATKTDVNGKLADVDTKLADVDTKLADSEQVIAGGISELKNKVDAATATTYTKTDVDNKLAAKLDTSAYTKVNTSDFATAANTYTKSEVDTALNKKQNVLTIDDKLDKTSTNAVQNKAIATELENLMKAISGVLNDINERLNTLSNTVAKQIKNSTE